MMLEHSARLAQCRIHKTLDDRTVPIVCSYLNACADVSFKMELVGTVDVRWCESYFNSV